VLKNRRLAARFPVRATPQVFARPGFVNEDDGAGAAFSPGFFECWPSMPLPADNPGGGFAFMNPFHRHPSGLLAASRDPFPVCLFSCLKSGFHRSIRLVNVNSFLDQ
jgi:hypothetical protein